MVFYIVLGLIGVIAAYFWIESFWLDDYMAETLPFKIIGTGVCWSITMAFAAVFAGILLLIPAHMIGTDESPGGSVELKAINMGSDTNGSFFLGSGYVDDELSYSYYGKNPDGSYYADSVPAEDVTIVEDNDVTPKIEFIDIDLPDPIFTDWVAEWDTRYVIYVPEGSIKPMIDLNLPE